MFGQPNVLSAEGQTHGELRRVIDPPLLQEPGHACGSTFLGLTTRPERLGRVVENPASPEGRRRGAALVVAAVQRGLQGAEPRH